MQGLCTIRLRGLAARLMLGLFGRDHARLVPQAIRPEQALGTKDFLSHPPFLAGLACPLEVNLAGLHGG